MFRLSHALLILFIVTAPMLGAPSPPPRLAPPVVEGQFIRPAEGDASQPVWGIKNGIRMGLWPMQGPRGLIRIYAPYLGHGPQRMINFIAVEPIVGRARGLSELEPSAQDKMRGKAMWSTDRLERVPMPRPPWRPSRGTIVEAEGVKALVVHIAVEPFRNGARPVVQAVLRSDRPHEVAFRVFAADGGKPMASCVLTATMGNYARLRKLWLKGEVIDAGKLWLVPQLNRFGFTAHKAWPVDRMLAVRGEAVVAASPDEAEPEKADYDPKVAAFWRYQGKVATQYWRSPVVAGLRVQVNGRTAYWASQAPIPGGIAYENVELVAPFVPGQLFTFGVTTNPREILAPAAPPKKR